MIRILICVLVIQTLFACSSQKKSAPLNPNGDSELALLMRDMWTDGMDIKEAIEKGKVPKSHIDVSKLLTAEPTDSAQVATPAYQAYAKVYEQAYTELMAAEGDEIKPAYNNLVETCISCHQSTCPGPIVRIKKMELADSK